ncbi:membrane protein insertase YidC, partial [Acidobacteria bacterium ACD]|nr:membrane protein insertase YidC [Acidobacteria bacterium ACD]
MKGLGLTYGPLRFLGGNGSERAAEEHAAMTTLLRNGGAEVITVTQVLDGALKAAREAGALNTWLRGWAPHLIPSASKLTGAALLGAVDEFVYHNDPEGNFAPLTDPAGSFYWTRDSAVMTPRGVAICRFSNDARTPEATLVRFRYREADGNGVVRTYRFGAGYVVGLTAEREGPATGPVGLVLGPSLGAPSADELKASFTKPGGTVVLRPDGKTDIRAKDGLKEALPIGAGAKAVGIEDNYFLTVFLPGPEATATLRPLTLKTPAGEEEKESEVVLTAPGALATEAFLGPKEPELLDTVRPGMGRLVDYGWFTVVAKPLLWTLRWIHGFAPNWGVAIILITVLIKIVLFPLTYKQLVSMKRMSELQPKIETIRAKWSPKLKSDPEARLKMNEELMGLYKTEGVNPAGGCVPLLLQMPILFAFYQMLAKAIELRHAPFALWVQDLSAKDPYYVLPILMTVTMWLQQQMTPSTADATQKKILAVMPFIFGFMFQDLPSGLTLYWLV